MSLEAMYPSMVQPPAPVRVIESHADQMAARMYPTMPAPANRDPAGEVPQNQGLRLQAGLKTEQAEPQSDGADSAGVSSQEAAAQPLVITREVLDKALAPELLQQREAERAQRVYTTAHMEVLHKSDDPQVEVINGELVAAAFDHGVGREDFASIVNLSRRFAQSPPDPETLANWNSMTTEAEKQAASAALARNPLLAAAVRAVNIQSSPQLIRALAGKRR